MTSKECVKRAIHFDGPDRIPYHLPKPYPSDIVWIFPKSKDIKTEKRNGGTYRLSEWGSWWHVISDENMGEGIEPPIKEWKDYDDYKFPDVNEDSRYEHVEGIINSSSDKYIMGVLSASLFPNYWEARGLENFFMDLYLDTDKMENFLDRLVEIQMESVDRWSQYPIDGIVVGFDDWGLQDSLMIDPELWRKYFKPRYEKVWSYIHEKDLDVILHSCGEITSILNDMIDIGLNVINMDQQENMGIERLAKEFGGRICFWNPTDIQTILLNGTPKEIEEYTNNMMKTLGNYKGGFIGKYYPQPNSIGHTKENSDASFNTFVNYGCIY